MTTWKRARDDDGHLIEGCLASDPPGYTITRAPVDGWPAVYALWQGKRPAMYGHAGNEEQRDRLVAAMKGYVDA